MLSKINEEKFLKELKSIRDLHPQSEKFAKLLSKYDLPFTTREAIKILKKIYD